MLYRIYFGNNDGYSYCRDVNVSEKMLRRKMDDAVRDGLNRDGLTQPKYQWVAAVPNIYNPEPEFINVHYFDEFDITQVDLLGYRMGVQYQREKVEREGLSGFLEIFRGMHALAELFVDRDEDDELLSAIVQNRVLEEKENESQL